MEDKSKQFQKTSDNTARQSWMSLLAKAPEGSIRQRLNDLSHRPEYTWLRVPEIGTVMVRGKTSGTGSAFNLGEMTVTRCVLSLHSGEVGHAYVQGRRKACAEAAALVDAMMQTHFADAVKAKVLDPIQAESEHVKVQRASKAAATKVDFFTMVRGED